MDGANPFDQFDGAPTAFGGASAPSTAAPAIIPNAATPAAGSGNPFDQFDGSPTAFGPAPVMGPATESSNAAADTASPAKPVDRAPTLGQVGQQFGYGVLQGIPNAVEGVGNMLEKGTMQGFTNPDTGESLFSQLGRDLGINSAPDPAPAPYQPKVGGAINSALSSVGLNPNNLPAPQSGAERVANMAGQGAILAVAPELGGLGDAGLLSKIGALARPAAVGTISGGVGQAAAEVVPDQYKPLAMAAGALAGGLGAEGAIGAVKRVAGATGDYLKPLTPGGQQATAGDILATKAQTTPADLISQIDNSPSELVPGSSPTLFQQTGNMPLGGFERSVAAQNPAMFNEARAAQNSARLDALGNIQAEGHPEAVADQFRQQMADIDQQSQAAFDQATQATTNATNQLGAPMTAEAAGNQARAALQAQLDASKAQESQLWQAVDPDNTMTVVTSPVKRAVQNVYGDISPELATNVTPAETALADVVNSYGPTLPFQRLTDLRSVVSQAMRAAKSPIQPNDMAYGRLSQLRGAIEDAISDSVSGKAAQEQQAVAAGALSFEDTMAARWAADREGALGGQGDLDQVVGSPATALAGNAGNAAGEVGEGSGRGNVSPGASGVAEVPGGTATLASPEPAQIANASDKAGRVAISPSGYRVTTRPEIVDASTLDKATGDLQVRDRSRHASDAWIEHTASTLDPDQLMPSVYSDRGAPIVGADNIVDSGNGRMAAIRRAAQAYPDRYEAYKQSLRDAGFNVSSTGTPVLISRRTTELSPEARVRFNADSNGSAVARMSSTEMAQADTAALKDDVLNELAPGSITSTDNRAFVTKFLHNLSPNEASALVDRSGNLNADGVRRIENALVGAAYGDVDRTALQRFAEATDDNTRSIVGAMADSAGQWVKMRRAIADGDIPPEYDVTPALTDALRSIGKWREQALREKRPVGMVIKEGMSQLDMFSGEMPPEAQFLARAFYRDDNFGRAASRETISDVLSKYVQAARELGQPQLFGDASRVAPLEVLKNVGPKTDIGANVGQSDFFSPPGAGSSPEAVIEGTARSAFGENSAIDRPVVDGRVRSSVSHVTTHAEAPASTENLIDQGAADRLATATAATKARKEAFGAKPIANILQRPGASHDYKMPAGEVAGNLWRPGPVGGTTVKSILNAAKNAPDAVEAIRNTAAASLRSKGALTPDVLAKWRAAHADALAALETAAPGTMARFENVERATENLGVIARQRKEAIDAIQNSALGRVMKVFDPSDVTKAIGGIFGRSDSVKAMKEVADAARKNPEAFQGLRKAIIDHMQSKLIGNTEAGTSGRDLIKADQFQSFIGKNHVALRQVFSDEEINSMRAIAQDLKRANRSITAVRLPGGSNTAQDLSAVSQHSLAPTLLNKLMTLASEGGASAVGSLFGPFGAVGGYVGAHVLGSMRSAGISRVNDLVRDAMLDPDLARTLLMKAPKRLGSGSEVTLAHRLAKLGAVDTSLVASQNR